MLDWINRRALYNYSMLARPPLAKYSQFWAERMELFPSRKGKVEEAGKGHSKHLLHKSS